MMRIIIAGCLGMCLASEALADDGILYYYGSPKLMHGESHIRMVAEQVTAKVFIDHVEVHCRFEFHNEGPATVARVGFPDGDSHSFEDGTQPEPDLERFRSWVDGKPVSLKIQVNPNPGDNEPALYHVKTVRFAKSQTRVIEDAYRASLSGGGTNTIVSNPKGGKENLYVSQFTYIMSSGGSWRGNIGSASLKVQFMDKVFRKIRIIDQQAFGNPIESQKLAGLPLNRVICNGFAKPHASGNTIEFTRRNFKPTTADDVTLTFGWRRFGESVFGAKQ